MEMVSTEMGQLQSLPEPAYVRGGLPAIHQIFECGYLSDNYDFTLNAWEDLDEGKRRGDRTLLFDSANALVVREQRDVIGPDFDAMRGYSRGGNNFGGAVTWLMSTFGVGSIPNTRSYAQVFPEKVNLTVEIGGCAARLVTPFPDGNITVWADRRDFINEELSPAFRRLVEQQPAVLAARLAEPALQAAPRYSLLGNWHRSVAHLINAWDTELSCD